MLDRLNSLSYSRNFWSRRQLLGVRRPGAALACGSLAPHDSEAFNRQDERPCMIGPKRRQAGALKELNRKSSIVNGRVGPVH